MRSLYSKMIRYSNVVIKREVLILKIVLKTYGFFFVRLLLKLVKSVGAFLVLRMILLALF